MNFLLVVLLVMQSGIAPVYVDVFEYEQECQSAKVEQIKASIPRDAGVLYVAACLPVRNGTSADI